MSPRFTVGGRIARPVSEVFEAVVDPARLSGYFTTGGAQGRLAPGATVTWDFHDYPGAFPVYVIEVEKDRRICAGMRRRSRLTLMKPARAAPR